MGYLDGLPAKYIISDTHFSHGTMVKAGWRQSGWQGKLWDNWMNTVQPEDTVLHLGDIVFGGKQDLLALRHLTGSVSFIKGNHDQSQRVKDYQNKLGWKRLEPFTIQYEGYTVEFRHEPTWPLPNGSFLQVHGHIHTEPQVSLWHISCCVEELDYRPVSLKQLLDDRIEKLEALIATKHVLLAPI